MLRRLSVALFGLMLATADAAAQTDEAPDVIEWVCGVESLGAESIRCQFHEPVPGYMAGAAYQAPDARQITTDLFRPGATRNLTRLVREAPQRYAGEIWWIPLYKSPTDMELVRRLALSVMCGSDRSCSVSLVGPGIRSASAGVVR